MWFVVSLLAAASIDVHGLDGCVESGDVLSEVTARLPSTVDAARVQVAVDRAAQDLTVTTQLDDRPARVRTLRVSDADCRSLARVVALVVVGQVEELVASAAAPSAPSPPPPPPPSPPSPPSPPPPQQLGAVMATAHVGGAVWLRGSDPLATGGARVGAELAYVQPGWAVAPALGVVVDAAWPVPVGGGGGQLSTAALSLGLSLVQPRWRAQTWVAGGGAFASGVGFTSPRLAVLPWAALGACAGVEVGVTPLGALTVEIGADLPLTQVALAEEGTSARVAAPLLRPFLGVALSYGDAGTRANGGP